MINTLTKTGNKLKIRIALAIIFILAILVGYGESIVYLFDQWISLDEYSHGPLLIFISLYVLWGKRSLFSIEYNNQSWLWVFVVVFGLILGIAAHQTSRHTIELYSLVIVMFGMILTIGGIFLLKEIIFPLILLTLSIPIPYIINIGLTAELQRISSEIGAWMIKLSGTPVFLQGNIIELADYTLMVEEACSGLNYTFALLSIGVIWAYYFRSGIWQKIILVISTIPIAILTNSLRIAIAGFLVDNYGIESAEGFLHQFEGWLIFLVAFMMLIPVAWILTKTTKLDTGLIGSLDMSVRAVEYQRQSKLNSSTYPAVVSVLFVLVSTGVMLMTKSQPLIPERTAFLNFPSEFAGWGGKEQKLPSIVQDVLGADDYLIEDYTNASGEKVNLYLAYFSTQNPARGVHSPSVCMQGGGWNIIKHDKLEINLTNSGIVEVNRLITNRFDGDYLVYYWMQEQGEWVSNEYLARTMTLFNSLFKNRTDGSLVRVFTPIYNGDEEKASQVLMKFIAAFDSKIIEYLPH